MKSLRLHSCDMMVIEGPSTFEWILMVAAGSYAEVAMLAEQHVSSCRSQAVICEMNIQAQDADDGVSAGIRFAREPVLMVQVR